MSDDNTLPETAAPQPESLFPTTAPDTLSSNDATSGEGGGTQQQQEEAATLSTSPPAEQPLLSASAYYTVDQPTGSPLYDPWATVSVNSASAPSSSTPESFLALPSSGDGRFTPGRIAAFVGIAVLVVIASVGGMFAFARSEQGTMMKTQTTQAMTKPRPPQASGIHTPAPTPTKPAAAASPTARAATGGAQSATAVQSNNGSNAVNGNNQAATTPATTQQDTFQRQEANGDWGPNWQLSSSAQDTEAFSVNGVGQINALNTVDSGFYTAIFNKVAATGATEDVTVTVNIQHLFQQQKNVGIVLRWQNEQNYYKVYYNGVVFVLMKCVNGQKTQLSFVQFAASDDVLYSIRFRIQGNTLMAKIWQTTQGGEPAAWFVSATDDSLTNGQVGIRALLSGGDSVQMPRFHVTIGGSFPYSSYSLLSEFSHRKRFLMLISERPLKRGHRVNIGWVGSWCKRLAWAILAISLMSLILSYVSFFQNVYPTMSTHTLTTLLFSALIQDFLSYAGDALFKFIIVYVLGLSIEYSAAISEPEV